MSKELDKFGEFLVKNFLDKSLDKLETLVAGEYKAPSLQKLQTDLASLSDSQKEVLRQACIEVLQGGMHDLLFALEESREFDYGVQVLVDRKDIAKLSDGLQGEPYTEDGWISKFSAHSKSIPGAL